jgi:hypothetical protein
MQENSEEWMQLCEQAASEQDPEQLVKLVEQISVLIEAREQRLREGPSRPSAEAPKGSWPPLPPLIFASGTIGRAAYGAVLHN